jgi:CSLREA domain-containing protein
MSRTHFAALLVLAACTDTPSGPTTTADRPLPSIAANAIAAFQVTATEDAVDAAPGNGVCRTAAGVCTLRAAIQESNALAGENTINLPAGTYPLTLPPRSGKDDASGSHAITGPLKLIGAGTATTIIDGAALRAGDPGFAYTQVALKVVATAGNVTIMGLTVQNGGNWNGSCGGSNLRVEVGATVVLRKTTMRDGLDSCMAGGIRNDGTLTLDQSEVTGNQSGGIGGGITNRGTLTIGRSTISANFGEDRGGGIDNSGQLTMTNSTLSGNFSEGGPGGLSNSGAAVLNNVTLTRNDPGGVSTTGNEAVTEISNSIIGANVGSNCSGTLTSRGFNLIAGTAGCTVVGDGTGNLIGMQAKLGPLQNNGGPTSTHALQAGSPARNAGNPATPGSSATACPIGDQRLLPRSATRCDMGAVEMQ